MTATATPLRRQRGASLLFTLIALLVLGFAAVALTRSVDTATLIMGNLGFKQDTLQASNTGAETAISWLAANVTGTALENDSPANGYYATTPSRLDATGNRTSASDRYALVNWDGDDCGGVAAANRLSCSLVPMTGATAINGNEVKYLILRLCSNTGPAAGNSCLRPAASVSSATSERGALQPGGRIVAAPTSPYYQVIVRMRGPRNTFSFTETLVHF